MSHQHKYILSQVRMAHRHSLITFLIAVVSESQQLAQILVLCHGVLNICKNLHSVHTISQESQPFKNIPILVST